MLTLYIDFETYFDKTYSLKNQPTQAYLNNPQFKLLGAAVAIADGEDIRLKPKYLSPEQVTSLLRKLPRGVALCAHNASFDAAVAYKIAAFEPKRYICTMFAARYLIAQSQLPPGQTTSLKALAPLVGLEKMDIESDDLETYALRDLEILMALHKLTYTQYTLPPLEADLIDLHVRMAAIPVVDLDVSKLEELSQPAAYPEALKTLVRSRSKFAAALEAYGVSVEYKISEKTGLASPALAKTDKFMRSLLTHTNPKVKKLAELRLEVSSNIVQTRAKRLLSVGSPAPLPLTYYAAHTGRSGGAQALNVQNLPPAIKPTLLAPEGYKLIIIDSSQVEMRTLAWLSGQEDLLARFRNKVDPYTDFAAKLLNKKQVTEDERFIAKVSCLALQYGMGANGFLGYCEQVKAPVKDIRHAQNIVDTYRSLHPYIVAYWNRAYKVAMRDEQYKLPSGRLITYPDSYLRHQIFSKSKDRQKTKLWHGAVCENINQAVARDVVLSQTVNIAKRYRVVLSVHDEAVVAVPEDQAEEALSFCLDEFSKSPSWAPDLPVAGKACISGYYKKP